MSQPSSAAINPDFVARAQYDALCAQLHALLDDVLVLMDQHASDEVKTEARRRIIERHAVVKP